MIPAGLHYGGIRVIPPRRPVSQLGAAHRDSVRNAVLARTGLKGFGGLGATRRGCNVYNTIHQTTGTLSTKLGGEYGAVAAAAGDFIAGIVNSTACAQDDVAASQNTLTPDPNSGNAQLQTALAQQNQQLMMLMAQQNQQQAAQPAPSTSDKTTYLIAGGVAAAVVLVLLLKR